MTSACEPAVVFKPFQCPDAVHVVVFVLAHVNVVEPPLAMDAGAALRMSSGAGADTEIFML